MIDRPCLLAIFENLTEQTDVSSHFSTKHGKFPVGMGMGSGIGIPRPLGRVQECEFLVLGTYLDLLD